jgi:hypothetical protein
MGARSDGADGRVRVRHAQAAPSNVETGITFCNSPGMRSPSEGILALEVVRNMGSKSGTFLVRADDGQFYVAKLLTTPQAGRIFTNELVATRLAAILGLPVRPGGVIRLLSSLIPGDIWTQLDAQAGHFPRHILCFGSSYPGNPGENLVVDFLPNQLLSRVPNLRDAFWGSLVFDLWTAKTTPPQAVFSRPARNQRDQYSAWLINHGHCFGGPSWAFPDDPPLARYLERSVYSRVIGLESFEPFLSKIESLQLGEIENCTRDIPADWLAGEVGHLRRLVETLHARRLGIRQSLMEKIGAETQTFPNLS